MTWLGGYSIITFRQKKMCAFTWYNTARNTWVLDADISRRLWAADQSIAEYWFFWYSSSLHTSKSLPIPIGCIQLRRCSYTLEKHHDFPVTVFVAFPNILQTIWYLAGETELCSTIIMHFTITEHTIQLLISMLKSIKRNHEIITSWHYKPAIVQLWFCWSHYRVSNP